MVFSQAKSCFVAQNSVHRRPSGGQHTPTQGTDLAHPRRKWSLHIHAPLLHFLSVSRKSSEVSRCVFVVIWSLSLFCATESGFLYLNKLYNLNSVMPARN